MKKKLNPSLSLPLPRGVPLRMRSLDRTKKTTKKKVIIKVLKSSLRTSVKNRKHSIPVGPSALDQCAPSSLVRARGSVLPLFNFSVGNKILGAMLLLGITFSVITVATAKETPTVSHSLDEIIGLDTWTGNTAISMVGTVATGTWNGAAIGDSYISSASTWNAKQNQSANLDAWSLLAPTTKQDALGFTPEDASKKGVASGYASLDNSGKIPSTQLPTSIAGALNFKGTWNADTNSPTITSSIGTNGDFYIVSTAGATTLDGTSSWSVGDLVIFDGGGTWHRVPNANLVSSVNGKLGSVTLDKTDIGLSNVENTTLSTWIGSTNLTTIGTIVTGVWNGTTIGTTHGGTGLTSLSLGDILYASGANTLAALSKGTNGQVLTLSGGLPSWQSLPGGTPGTATWGAITGTLADQTDLKSAFDAKEGSVNASTTSTYYRGDKTFQTLNKGAVGLDQVPNIDTTNASNISTGTFPDARLSSNVVLLDGAGKLPAIDGSQLTNLPAGAAVWSTIIGKPTTLAGFGITDAFSGSYADLTNKPALFGGAYADLSGKPTLLSGSYTDLSNKPTIFDGKFSSLTGVPTTLSGFGITDAQITSGKDTSDGYVGLTLFKINFKNNANTSTSFFTNANTTARTYTFPDKNGTVAMTSDITGTNSGVNTGDQTITLTGDVTGSGTGSFAVTIANGSVTEAKQTLADNTTNNVSTINHGYAPKAPNDTTKFFRGDGTWATLPAAAVTSVFGRTSAVTAQSNDYTWAQIDKTTSSLADFTTRAITDLTGTLGVNHGGTGATTLTSNGILFGNGTSALGVTVAGTNGQLLLGVTSGAPAFGTLSGDATITNAGALTIAASAITNAKVSATAAIAYSKLNLTGAILNTDLAGSITASKLVGTDITTLGTITTGTWNGTAIAVANGGTGQTTYTNGQILIGNTTLGTLAKTNLTPGSGIDVTNGAGTITIANGAPAMISGGTGANDIPASLTSFAPFGFMAPQTSDASGTTRTVVTRSGTIKNLFVVQSAVSGNSKTISYTVTKNGVSQTLTASVTGNSVATANDTTHSFTVAAGDEIGITMVAGAVGAGNRANWSVDFVN